LAFPHTRTVRIAAYFLKKIALEKGIYVRSFSLSSRVFYSEYPENPSTLGEIVRKAMIDHGLMTGNFSSLVGAYKMILVDLILRTQIALKAVLQAFQSRTGYRDLNELLG